MKRLFWPDWGRWQAMLACAVIAFNPAGARSTQAEPTGKSQRIVSLNLCSDQILLDLVSRDRIAALSFLSQDPSMTPAAEEAKGLRSVQGSAEEVLALDPDLILAGEYSTPATVSLLERLGRRVVKVPQASTFAEIRSLVSQIARVTGEEPKGAALIAAFDARLAAIHSPNDGKQPTVVAMQVNSLASGAGTMLDAVFQAAGWRNMASDYALGPAGRLPLETFLLHPPDLVVYANAPDDFRTVLGDNLRHPAMSYLAKSQRSLHLPMKMWLCGTPRIATAVEHLANARRAIEQDGTP